MDDSKSNAELSTMARAFRDSAPDELTRLPGGRNNVVARVTWAGEPALLKVYFQHPGDLRDRLGSEFGMLSFLWDHGVRDIPRPIESRPDLHAALYEFVDGITPKAGQVTRDDVMKLSELLGRMRSLRNQDGAENLPAASDAQFSIDASLASLDARIERLAKAEGARDFVTMELAPAWRDLMAFIADRCASWSLDASRALPPAERTLTPADHGFHNSLRRADGRLVFLDFEYSGWDDPAQMVANAWLQPEAPMPVEYRGDFVRDAMARLGAGGAEWRRLRIVYPLMAFKWSLILMNEFLPVDGARRAFAGGQAGVTRAAQLAKARAQLDVVRDGLSDRSWLDELMRSCDVAGVI